jgi:hypothetical protein
MYESAWNRRLLRHSPSEIRVRNPNVRSTIVEQLGEAASGTARIKQAVTARAFLKQYQLDLL